MLNQKENITRKPGGIALRDYTGSQVSPRMKVGLNAVQNGFRNWNFDRFAHWLTVASLGLGLAELIFPRAVQRLAGIRGKHHGLVRAAGARELSSAGLIYMQARPFTGIWARVIGDVMDLAALGYAFTFKDNHKNRLAGATGFVAVVSALDVLALRALQRELKQEREASTLTRADFHTRLGGGAYLVTRSVTINRPAHELYQFWRNFENLPQFMYHLESVEVYDNLRSHWVTSAPAGQSVEWDAVITDDQPDRLIAWRSEANADVPNSGVVRFLPAPAGRGTVVRVEMAYRPPAGALGRVAALVTGEDAGQQVTGDLHRFKQVMETGEVVRSDGSPAGYSQKKQRPAQPLKDGGVKPEYERSSMEQPLEDREWIRD